MTKFIYSSRLLFDEELSVLDVMAIKDKLRSKPPLNCAGYMLIESENPNDMLEIVSIPMLNLYRGPRRKIRVYGLASDKEGAIRVLDKLISDCLKNRGDCNLKEYLK